MTARGLLAGVGVAADAGAGELVVEFADERIKLSGVLTSGVSVVAELLGIGALFQQPRLPVIGRGGLDDGLVFEVPAFPALSSTQAPGPFRAGRAHCGEGGAAGHEDLLDVAGVDVGAAQAADLDVEPVALTGVYKNMNRAIIALVFRCKTTGGQLQATDEAEGHRWAAEADIRELASEAYAIRVLDALHEHAPAAIRQHDGTQLL